MASAAWLATWPRSKPSRLSLMLRAGNEVDHVRGHRTGWPVATPATRVYSIQKSNARKCQQGTTQEQTDHT
jgi:hypothetical protein